MAYLPVELALEPEDTTVVGDIDAFIEQYVESGQALHDWDMRLAALVEAWDTFLGEHSHAWSHIVMQKSTPHTPMHDDAR